jgi:nucleotide-binding universal stress UspA family protein
MFKRILVPLDGSSLAEQAIPHAELFARIFGSKIILLQVLEPTSYHENPKAIDPLTWQIRKAESDMYLQSLALRIQKKLGGNNSTKNGKTKNRVDYVILEGKIAENIVNFAHSQKIDLLVISSHGSGGLSRWNISSITQKVINLIYLPVLLVRAYTHVDLDEGLNYYRKILLPIDSSRRAECSLSAGIELARGMNPPDTTPENSEAKSILVLAAVIRPPELPIPEPLPLEITQLSDQLIEVSRMAVYQYLNEMKMRVPVECETCVVENKSAAFAIQELADQEDIDMVVLCAHGHSGQVSWPYGTITRNYIEHGTKPVLVVQDIPLSQVRPTAAEIASEESGRR